MKIISSFHDYYDSLSYTDNDDVCYIRKKVDCKNYKGQSKFDVDRFNNHLRLTKMDSIDWISIRLIAFCGKLYFLFRPNSISIYMTRLSVADRDKLIWYNPELIIPDIVNQLDSKPLKTALIKNETQMVKNFKDYMSQASYIINANMIEKLALMFNAPYFKIKPDYYTTTYNICANFDSLEKIKFYKVMDVNQTYQEINMYLNSVLITNKEYPQITDDTILITAKGFDLKTSFRHPIK